MILYNKPLSATLIVAVLALGGTGLVAYAQTSFDNTKISLTQAIEAATGQAGGKVTETSMEVQGGVPVYNITVDTAGKTQTVLIDMQTGKIVSVVADNSDNGAETNDGNEAGESGEPNEANEQNGGPDIDATGNTKG